MKKIQTAVLIPGKSVLGLVSYSRGKSTHAIANSSRVSMAVKIIKLSVFYKNIFSF